MQLIESIYNTYVTSNSKNICLYKYVTVRSAKNTNVDNTRRSTMCYPSTVQLVTYSKQKTLHFDAHWLFNSCLAAVVVGLRTSYHVVIKPFDNVDERIGFRFDLGKWMTTVRIPEHTQRRVPCL